MPVTIGVWSPTLLEEQRHCALSSLLVSVVTVAIYEYDHRVRIIHCAFFCVQPLSYLTS